MERETIKQKLTAIFQDVLNSPSLKLDDKMTAADVEGWDSLYNIQIIIAVEKMFKIRFKATEIRGWKNVGEMCDSILKAVA